jgi:hypothetical protein
MDGGIDFHLTAAVFGDGGLELNGGFSGGGIGLCGQTKYCQKQKNKAKKPFHNPSPFCRDDTLLFYHRIVLLAIVKS